MPADVAHRRWWQIFEVVFGIPLLAAIALQLAVPLALPYGSFAPVIVLGAIALILVGAALVVLARREFARHGQPTDPGRPTGKVITSGVFSISRNPLYLGGACILAGIGVGANLPWVLVFLLPSLVACHHVLIMPEEKYLASKFGEEYNRYTRSVQRWLGRARGTDSDGEEEEARRLRKENGPRY